MSISVRRAHCGTRAISHDRSDFTPLAVSAAESRPVERTKRAAPDTIDQLSLACHIGRTRATRGWSGPRTWAEDGRAATSASSTTADNVVSAGSSLGASR